MLTARIGAAILLYLLLLLPEDLGAQGFRFVGFYSPPAPGQSYLCADTQMEQKELADRGGYGPLRSEFMATRRGQLPETHLLIPGEAAIIYESERRMAGFGCTKKVLSIARAVDIEAAHAAMAARTEARGARIVYSWYGTGASREILVREYEGVEIKYTVGTTQSGRTTVVAQIHNRRETAAGVVAMTPKGAAPFTLVVQPGEQHTRSFPVLDDLSIEITFRPAEARPWNPRDNETIRLLEKKILDSLYLEEGKFNPRGPPSAIGIRG